MRLKYFCNQLLFNLKSKLYRKYLISYLAVFLIPVIVLMGINIMIYHNSLKTSMAEIGRESTAKFKLICDDVLSRANRMVYNISGTSSVIRALKHGDVNMAIEVQNIIDSILVTDEVITDAFIYSGANKRIYTKASSTSLNSFLYQEGNPESRELVKNIITAQEDSVAFVKASNIHMEKGTLIYTFNQSRSDGLWYNILFLIDRDYIINAMNYTECVGAIIYNGEVIISNNTSDNFDILKLDEGITYYHNGIKYMVYSEKSDYADITYLMLVPESAVIKELAGINWAILFVLVIWGVIMIVFLANRNYNPIKSITENAMDILGVTKAEETDSLRFINDAIVEIGKQSKEYDEMHEKLRFMQQLVNGDYNNDADKLLNGIRYSVFIIKAMPQKVGRMINLNEYVSYIEENVLDTDDCLLGIAGSNLCIILLCDDGGKAETKADLCYNEICRLIDGRVTAGVGMSYATDKISYSYSEAIVSLEYSSVSGCLVYYENINGLEDITGYPMLNIDRIKNLLCSGKIDEVNEEIKVTITEMISRKQPIFLVKCVCYELVSVIIREIDKLSVGKEKITIDINKIMKIDNLHHLIQFVENMSYMYRNAYEKAMEHKKNIFIEDVEEYINSHFCDNDFYVNKIADNFGISVSNLSKQFRKHKNCNITQYVTTLQMERAKELLRTTDYSMSVIAKMVGQQDVSNFIRKFKAHEKITPGEYRKSAQA